MKKPTTINELTDIIKNLEHRERVVFELNKDYVNENNAVCEIYGTQVFSGSMFEDQFNIAVTFADVCGKWHKGNPKRSMKRRLLFADSYGKVFMEKIFAAIKA